MNTYKFSLVLNGVDKNTPNLEDTLFEAGCDDGLICSYNNTVYVDFIREANSYKEAVLSAIKNIESSPLNAKVVSVDNVALHTVCSVPIKENLVADRNLEDMIKQGLLDNKFIRLEGTREEKKEKLREELVPFDKERLRVAIDSNVNIVPEGLSREETREFILSKVSKGDE